MPSQFGRTDDPQMTRLFQPTSPNKTTGTISMRMASSMVKRDQWFVRFSWFPMAWHWLVVTQAGSTTICWRFEGKIGQLQTWLGLEDASEMCPKYCSQSSMKHVFEMVSSMLSRGTNPKFTWFARWLHVSHIQLNQNSNNRLKHVCLAKHFQHVNLFH